MNDYRSVRVAVLGAGTVGSQVAAVLLERREELARRIGADIELVGVAVRRLDAPRDRELPRELLTTDAESLVLRADIVIELMGGIEPAKSLIERAIDGGADVVTGNKALIAAHGTELFERAERVGAAVYYEAAVAAAIPIIRPLRESLAGDNVTRILAIVNGSTNFILDRMHRFGDSAEAAQATALELGYLEADPTLDVEGYDAAQKAAILASLAFHTEIPADAVYREGITSVTADQVESARQAGYVIKLLAIVEKAVDADGAAGVSVRVYPALLNADHPLASVHGGNNAVFVEAEMAGPLMFYGAGAGGQETASAVLGDTVSAARRHVAGGPGIASSTHAELPVLPIGLVRTRYYITLTVTDRPGVLADVAGVFSRGGVSVQTVRQDVAEGDTAGTATLVIGTHAAGEAALRETVAALADNASVVGVESVLRVEGAE
ncbi:homoserine dehydrogenase [Mycetocola reblochoni]|uniref:Homoserine dehydrogenase n=2 Tax=Mycetocola reblochoni TaxID=331618 RepID=A0A1R4JT73_9MICO|nr:homoserine dehydrogenase [Mycetocola reblochoni]RLP70398.1 homoserine dehydrogenase [Mycetocola reblochoni]SJN35290.1 Homoserine dehydrogenase [Mycetocola reblochoni REB411]